MTTDVFLQGRRAAEASLAVRAGGGFVVFDIVGLAVARVGERRAVGLGAKVATDVDDLDVVTRAGHFGLAQWFQGLLWLLEI